MKQIKDNIVYVLVGFTLVVSVYSVIKIQDIKKEVRYVQYELASVKLYNKKINNINRQISELERIDLVLKGEISDYESEIRRLKSDIDSDKRNMESKHRSLEIEISQVKSNMLLHNGIRHSYWNERTLTFLFFCDNY